MNPKSSSRGVGESRRSFLRHTTVAAASVSAGVWSRTPARAQNQAPSPGRVLGANDRIRVAYIGTGKQGMEHVRLQQKFAAQNNIAQVAVCDLYQPHLDQARTTLGLPEARAYRRIIGSC